MKNIRTLIFCCATSVLSVLVYLCIIQAAKFYNITTFVQEALVDPWMFADVYYRTLGDFGLNQEWFGMYGPLPCLVLVLVILLITVPG